MIWTAILLIPLLYWLIQAIATLRLVRGVDAIGELPLPDRAAWPRLSIIVPACNEGETLEPATRSKLAEGYPNLELVLVDDRSTDSTGEVVDRMAAADPRVRALHVRALPAGWLGKLHALQRGLEVSSGEWVLFSDADIHYAPGLLRRAIAYAEDRGLDHLSVFPALWPVHPLLDAVCAAFARVIALMARLWRVADPRSSAFAGVGAFNLVRRATLDRTRGLEWIKLETGDDVALGQMLKKSGARSAAAVGREHLGVQFHRTMGELSRSVEKGMAFFDFRVAPAVIGCAVVLFLEAGAFAALPFARGPALAVAAATAGLAVFVSVTAGRFLGLRLLGSLLAPVGMVVLLGIFFREAIRVARQGGLRWRGTLYRAEELMAGRRLQFP